MYHADAVFRCNNDEMLWLWAALDVNIAASSGRQLQTNICETLINLVNNSLLNCKIGCAHINLVVIVKSRLTLERNLLNGVKFPGKMRYVTLEFGPSRSEKNHTESCIILLYYCHHATLWVLLLCGCNKKTTAIL